MLASLFFSYSHKDETLRNQLETHLSMLKRQGLIEAWHDRRIAPGADLDSEIGAQLESADVILLLVSPDFLASDYCYNREMARSIERHEAGEAAVIPVILRPCDWHGAPFGGLLATPTDGKPITTWPNIDEAFLAVITVLKTALTKRVAVPTSSLPRLAPRGNVSVVSDIRSSNLRVAKHFTEREKDQFLHEAFEYLAKFFESSLHELAQRNAEIEGTFRRIDANRFTAVAYRSGQAAARCSISLGGLGLFSGGIAYSANDAAESNSFNERLSVGADEHALFLTALGMSRLGHGNERGKLSMQGGAELFWGLFIEPLQRR
jgi:hypothetical protein